MRIRSLLSGGSVSTASMALSISPLFLGCSSSGASNSGLDGSVESGAVSSGADGGASAAGPEAGLNSGNVSVTADYMNGSPAMTGWQIGAGFDSDSTGGGAGVIFTEDAGLGSCSVTQGAPPRQTGTFVGAGTLTVTGEGAPIVISPTDEPLADGGSTVIYERFAVDAGALTPGDMLTLTTSGGAAPAFSIEVEVPGTVTLTNPDFADASSPFVISRAADLAFAWTANGTGTVGIGISQLGAPSRTSVGCLFPESAGSGVIPSEVLAYLIPSADFDAGRSAGTTLQILTTRPQSMEVGGWTMTAEVGFTMLLGPASDVSVQ